MTDAYVKAWNCNLYFMEALRVYKHYKMEDIINDNQYCFTIPEEEIDEFNNLSIEEKLHRYKKECGGQFKLIYVNEGHHETSCNYLYIKTKECLHTNIGSFYDTNRLKIVHGETKDNWFVHGLTREPKMIYMKDISIPDILKINPEWFKYQRTHETDIRAMIEHEKIDKIKESIKEEIFNFGKYVKENHSKKDFEFESNIHYYRNVPFVLTYGFSETYTSKMFISIDTKNENFYHLISDLFNLDYGTWWLESDIDIFDKKSIGDYVDELMIDVINDTDKILKEIPIKINKKYEEIKKLDKTAKKFKHW